MVGAHLEGMPLHQQLVERHCHLLKKTTTAKSYRLYALAGTIPPKPGLVRVDSDGSAIELEVYAMPLHEVGSFLARIETPLGLGNIELADGSWVKGFICEPYVMDSATDISLFGGWRRYCESLRVK